MKKRVFIIVILICLVTYFVLLIAKYNKAEKYKKSISEFPTINISDYVVVNNISIEKGKMSCFIMFNTECDFCLDEIEDIVDNIDYFENVNFFLVSNQAKDVLLEYSMDSEFLGLDSFILLSDSDFYFNDYFKSETVPSLYLYSVQGKLISYKNGFVPVSTLKELVL